MGAPARSGAPLPGTLYILSNNHVLADVNEASIGDPTLQPGPYDGGTAADSVASLADYVPISFSRTNYVDTAIAQTVAANVDSATSSEGYGTPNATIVDLDGDSDPNTISTIDGSYDADSNHDPDGDSDGTTVEVSKP